MHIKDLKMDVELDGTALAAVRGGSGPAAFCLPTGPQQPELPTYGGDWTQLGTDIQGYIGDVKADAGFPSFDITPSGKPEMQPAPGYVAV